MPVRMTEDEARQQRYEDILKRKLDEIHELEEKMKLLRHQVGELQFIFGDREALDERRNGRPRNDAVLAEPPKRFMSKAARAKISAAARARWAKTPTRKARKAKKNADGRSGTRAENTINRWAPEEDQKIIDATRKGAVEITEAARELAKTMPSRSEGAIRQRAYILGKKGKVKVFTGANKKRGGLPHLMMEAA